MSKLLQSREAISVWSRSWTPSSIAWYCSPSARLITCLIISSTLSFYSMSYSIYYYEGYRISLSLHKEFIRLIAYASSWSRVKPAACLVEAKIAIIALRVLFICSFVCFVLTCYDCSHGALLIYQLFFTAIFRTWPISWPKSYEPKTFTLIFWIIHSL